MVDEKIVTKEEWYDLKPYRDEVRQFVTKKRNDLDVLSNMEKIYDKFYKIIFSGSTESDVERFPHAAEMYKVYKSAIIESSLSGYSALVELNGDDAYSELLIPKLSSTMKEQFRSMAMLERLSGETLDDWILKGEAVSFIKLKETKEEYKNRETITDAETGEELARVTIKQGVTYRNLDLERIDPLDFYVDAYDYDKDPLGCAKIIRSWIDSKSMLTSDDYPLLSKEDKEAIVLANGRNGRGGAYFNWSGYNDLRQTYNKTDKNQIEVLTFYGDYITNDNKVLSNIKAVLVGGYIASLEYNKVSVNRIIYAPYKVDRQTHRSVSPLASTIPVNSLINKVTDLFIRNLQDTTDPIMLFQKGSITSQQAKEARTKRQLEYNGIGDIPQFWSPPMANPTGLQLMELILGQNKNMLGLNSYMAGDSTGSVRTAEEASILFQRANARMRVETDVFSYRFMLNLFTTFYAFNRELALAMDSPLAEIYADPQLKVSISTNASKADREGELQRLMQMLNLPISQMIFSNLTPEQVVLAVRYLMAKANLNDADNLLELIDSEGNIQYPQEDVEGVPPPQEEQQIPQDVPMNDIQQEL